MNTIMSVINGQTVASTEAVIEKRYPATGEVIAEIQPATPTMLDEAVRHAKAAQAIWAAEAAHERARILNQIALRLAECNEELSRLEVLDVGKTLAEAITADVPSGSEAFEFFASLCATYHGTSHKWPNAIGYTQRVPLGVCAGIGAWNYPVQVACWKAAPALAAGNAFILKPSEETPLTANALADLFQQAGLPDGLFQVIHGDHVIGRAICEHKGIAKISLTGSVDTGRQIIAQSAATLKKVTLELGGKAPLLVFDDCDFELAIQTALDANFYTAGEVCSNATRVFVQDTIADRFIETITARTKNLVVGDPMAADTQIGALISQAHLESVQNHIEHAQHQGATLATGGMRIQPQGCEDGYFLSPAILTGCSDDMDCVVSEIFGPVMSVLSFADEAEAVARANATEFGLGAGILTQDISRAHRVADQLQAGNIWINSYNLIPPGLPFGGSKQSGFGREGSVYALEAYTEVKATYVQI